MTLSSRFFSIFLVATLCFTSISQAEEQRYQKLAKQQNTASEKVVVTEFFSYGCPHCNNFQPFFNEWKKTKPDSVELRQIPAVFSSKWENYARAFYAAEVMNVLNTFHQPMFQALHTQKRKLNNLKAIAKFAGSLGIDENQFLSTMKSFGVSTKINAAKEAYRAYGITGVPTVTVNGKYMTNGSLAGSYPAMIETINQLITKEAG